MLSKQYLIDYFSYYSNHFTHKSPIYDSESSSLGSRSGELGSITWITYFLYSLYNLSSYFSTLLVYRVAPKYKMTKLPKIHHDKPTLRYFSVT